MCFLDSQERTNPITSLYLKADPKLKLKPEILVSMEEKRLADLIKEKYLPKFELTSKPELSKPIPEVDAQVVPNEVSTKRKAVDQLSSNLAKRSRVSSSTSSQSSTSQQFFKIFKFNKKEETGPEKVARPEFVRVSGFCTDCEGCKPGCRHLNHPRKFVRDLSIHELQSNHLKFQTVIFQSNNPKVRF